MQDICGMMVTTFCGANSLYYEDLESGLHLMPKITLDHLNLTSYSKMNVHLAAQVLSTTVSNVLKEFGPGNAATF